MANPVAKLSSSELLDRLRWLVQRDNALEAELLVTIGEVDTRRLYLEEGCSSMFAYCQRVLHFAEGVAYKRIHAARAVRRHPEVWEALRRGDLHLTAVCLLASRLTRENVRDLVRGAKHKSAEEIRRMLADLAPRPERAASVRRLPAPTRASGVDTRTVATVPAAGRLARVAGFSDAARPQAAAPSAPSASPPARPVEPLGRQRYAVRFTADGELHAKLQELRALMRHQVPDGDLGVIIGRAVEVLLAQVRRQKFGECPAPRGSTAASARRRPSRHVPAAIRREVARRDGERCSYVSPSGRRCEAREFLEFHHETPWTRVRTHSGSGITLRCRAHNQLAARRDFGEAHMAKFVPGGT